MPLSAFPFPYKYLIGVGFYFFIKHQVDPKAKVIAKMEYCLFLPAILYGLIRTYWYVKLHSGLDKAIFLNVYKSGFFTYNEFVYLLFNLVLMIFTIRFLKRMEPRIKGSVSKLKNWKWLRQFSWAFMVVIILNLLHQTISNLFGFQDSRQYYLIILVLNSIYIYWIGFIGYTKSNLLFKTYALKDEEIDLLEENPIKTQLEYYIHEKEIFTNQNLKVVDLAELLKVTEKELSLLIHEHFGKSFTDYINFYRVEKVKTLLFAPDQERFTMLAIAEKAGFSSKSSFNAVFKKLTGMTPSQYKKEQLK